MKKFEFTEEDKKTIIECIKSRKLHLALIHLRGLKEIKEQKKADEN